jgi:predicted cupin superfamily sugar epimerase
MSAEDIIQQLALLPHPEGGFYKEVYRSSLTIKADSLPPQFGGDRSISTSIYYLLQEGDFSAFHRIKSDELWHFYAGGTLLLHLINESGEYYTSSLGPNLATGETFQVLMPAGVWFASEPAPGTLFTLAGCTVSPGFDFLDFEMAEREQMIRQFPRHKAIIERLSRQPVSM